MKALLEFVDNPKDGRQNRIIIIPRADPFIDIPAKSLNPSVIHTAARQQAEEVELEMRRFKFIGLTSIEGANGPLYTEII